MWWAAPSSHWIRSHTYDSVRRGFGPGYWLSVALPFLVVLAACRLMDREGRVNPGTVRRRSRSSALMVQLVSMQAGADVVLRAAG